MSETTPQLFTPAELKRVGTAATMIVVCGTLIVLAVMAAVGHYNPLAHCAPKAVLDGAVIALLLGARGRWRNLALLGVVYGFVLLIQVGIFYLLPVAIMAGCLAASVGFACSKLHRPTAILLAAATYEWLISFGTPVKIYFAVGVHEPLVWTLWLVEWPLRIVGAAAGAMIALRWIKRRGESVQQLAEATQQPMLRSHTSDTRRRRDVGGAAIRLAACALASTVPMALQSWSALAGFAAASIIFALLAGVRKALLGPLIALCWGWLLFAALSYAVYRDPLRTLDLGRTLVLRFLPIAMTSVTLVKTARPADIFRLLRKLHLSGFVLIPLASVARGVRRSGRTLHASIDTLRRNQHWSGWHSLVRRPMLLRALIAPQVRAWAVQLTRENHDPPRRSSDELANVSSLVNAASRVASMRQGTR